jgi:acetylornithine deacetylase/succinyl-diaminopimelate desuccinylase-like protein
MMRTEKELVQMTKELIQIPSECTYKETYREITSSIKTFMEDRGINPTVVKANPESLSPGWDVHLSGEVYPPASEYSWFETVSMDLKRSRVEKYNITGQIGEGDFTLVIHAHIDTRCLGNESWEHSPFSGEIEKGHIYGLGAADNKSGIASGIVSVSEIQSLERISVLLTFTADEEVGGYTGMGYLSECTDMRQNLVLSTNGPFYKVNVGCWGRLWAFISVEEPQSHENTQLYHFLRENLYPMNRVLWKSSLQIAGIYQTKEGLINVTCNMFSPECSPSYLYSFLCEVAPDFDFGMKVAGMSDHVVSSKNPLFTHFSSALENVLGERLTYQMGPLSDIRFPLRRGVDAAAFGPIRKDSNVHKPDENVRIKDLVQCTRVYQHFICALDGTQSL